MRRTPCSPNTPGWKTILSSRKLVLLAGILFYSGTAFAQDQNLPDIPAQYAYVKQTRFSKSGKPLVLLIQDAHTQYSAQKNLSCLLRKLVRRYGVGLIFTEGGAGDISLDKVSGEADRKKIRETAERYLKSGEISGEEYLSLTWKRSGLVLWGLEDPDLYARHMEAYLSFTAHQEEALAAAARLREKITGLQKEIYPDAFYRVEELRHAAEQGQDLDIYFEKLIAEARASGMDLKEFPGLMEWRRLTLRTEAGFTEKAGQLEGMDLFDEADTLYRAIREKKLQDPQARKLALAAEYLEGAERLFRLQASHRDAADFKSLTAKVRKEKPPLSEEFEKEDFKAWTAQAFLFYESALKREEAMFENLMKKIPDSPQPFYIFIAGGFHTPGLIDRLTLQDFSFMNVVPRFLPGPEDRGKYERVLRAKWDPGRTFPSRQK